MAYDEDKRPVGLDSITAAELEDDDILIVWDTSSGKMVRMPKSELHEASTTPATTSLLGEVSMSVAPADSANPIAVGDNDPRVANVEHTTNKNQANGYPGLGADSKIDGTQQKYGTAANTAAEGNDSRFENIEYTTRKNQASGYAGLDETSKLDGTQQKYGASENTAAEGNDSRIPTQDENDALAGSYGTPSSSNRFLTETDPAVPGVNDPSILVFPTPFIPVAGAAAAAGGGIGAVAIKDAVVPSLTVGCALQMVPSKITLQSLIYVIGTRNSTDQYLAFGIYTKAGARVLDSTWIAPPAAGASKKAFGAITLNPGAYYFAFATYLGSGSPATVLSVNMIGGLAHLLNGGTTKFYGTAANAAVFTAEGGAALPATLGAITAQASMQIPIIGYHSQA